VFGFGSVEWTLGRGGIPSLHFTFHCRHCRCHFVGKKFAQSVELDHIQKLGQVAEKIRRAP
jgi:hypothetical protein